MSDKHILRVLVAPLDWGLGHTTRCIPLIKYLLDNGCHVIIGCEGSSERLLRLEFPHLQFVALKGYRIHYTHRKRLLPFKILCQLPKIWIRVKKEHKWLSTIVKEQAIDLVISDNRYGLWLAQTHSVFITHQLQIKGPYKWIERMLRLVNYRYINKFNECWVPDMEANGGLAGVLSHPQQLPVIPVKYLGVLSRFQPVETAYVKYTLLIVLSGPEPQRSIFENIIIAGLQSYHEPVLLVRGLPGARSSLQGFNKVEITNHQSASELQQSFAASKYVVARAGYTTIMDIVKMAKAALLVPTPGQTEQEYLAEYLQQQHICASIPQQKFSLPLALQTLDGFEFRLPAFDSNQFKPVVDECLSLVAGDR